MDARTARNARMLIDEGSRLLRGTDAGNECSFLRSINQLIDNPHAGTAGSGSSPEVRASRSVAERLGRPPAPGTMCFDVAPRDATVAGTGGYLVAAEAAPGDVFVSALRANSVAAALGVRELRVERANAALPKVAGDIRRTGWRTRPRKSPRATSRSARSRRRRRPSAPTSKFPTACSSR